MKRLCLNDISDSSNSSSSSSTSIRPLAQLTLPVSVIGMIATFARTVPDPMEFTHTILNVLADDVHLVIRLEYFYDEKGNLMGFFYVSHLNETVRVFTWLLAMNFHHARHEYEFMCEYEGIVPNTSAFENFFSELSGRY